MTLEEKIMFIEKNIDDDCEFLLRTNHDPDKCSGQPIWVGKWMVHLQRASGTRLDGNVSHKTVYLGYGDHLDELLDNVIEKINKEDTNEKYEFHVGDYVENVDGLVGVIDYICDCSDCKERGFFEPHIKYVDGSFDFITKHQTEHMEELYKRVGKYEFKEKTLESQYQERLALLDKLLKQLGYYKTSDLFKEIIDRISLKYCKSKIDVLNSLIEEMCNNIDTKNVIAHYLYMSK